ncbi:hypothetical protein AMS68_001309 [Peltaster fructicola]|uniref:Threonine/serine exporter-like N-terminal domain-containing protein n=1 Tax=Peltaster fructicola TaxID=286661 RepID=A0A6H0XM16_9PEZI|nr:hypothetical protein AMS68_001309 [Peltaster fructicola]
MATPNDELVDPFGRAFAMANLATPHDDSAPATSADTTSPGTPCEAKPREKKRVGFSGSDAPGAVVLESAHASGASTPEPGRSGSIASLLAPSDRSHLPQLAPGDAEQIKQALSTNNASRPRPAIRNVQPSQSHPVVESEDEDGSQNREKAYRRQKAREALQRGKDLERDERIRSAPTSRQVSPHSTTRRRARPDLRLDNLPAEHYNIDGNRTGESTPRYGSTPGSPSAHTPPGMLDSLGLRSGAVTPIEDRHLYEEYKPPPKKYRGGILGQLLKLSQHYGHDDIVSPHDDRRLNPDVGISTQLYSFARGSITDLPGTTTPIPGFSPPESGASTPRDRRPSWYSFSRSQSTSSISQLKGSSSSLGAPASSSIGEEVTRRLKEHKARRPHLKERVRSSGALHALSRHVRPKTDEELRIKKHISEILQRQQYLIKLCKGLMMYGAPSHRLEEYMKMSSRVLQIEAQFLYLPGAMLMSFNDPSTHTTELKLVKVPQGLDLGRLRDVHEIYKEVVHDRMSVSTAREQLNTIFEKKPKHSRLLLVVVYGLASVCVGPFAFGARLIDLPIAFLIGAIVGILQLYVAQASELYQNVFEIAASVVTSFLARLFGSIYIGNHRLFCFSALAQSPIALILPGYMVLLASLELQSKSMVAGSVRMVYAIIYSLFLGYGITLGTAIYGLLDKHAVSATTCDDSISKYWYILFVPGFTMCLIIVNQAKWKQAPMMLVIASVGYVVNYFSAQRFVGNTQISNMFGALAIGVMANGYSRVGGRVENIALDIWETWLRRHWRTFREKVFLVKKLSPKKLEAGLKDDPDYAPRVRRVGYSLAAAAMLPGIFVQVPSGIAVGGSLLTGLASANLITNSSYTNGTQISNTTSVEAAASALNTVSFNVGYSVVQVAIGITVGLFLSAIVVYPFGKKRSGLFSF